MASGDFEKKRLQPAHGPDLHFEGRLVGAYSTQNRAETKRRWTELQLWETRGGAWIAESVGRTVDEREFDIVEAAVIEAGGEEEVRRRAVMEAWGWTSAAKAFAREQGWDVVRKVD